MIDEHDVREMLHRRASAAPVTFVDVPKAVRRARRRLAVNGMLATLVAAAITVTAFAGVDAIRSAPVPADGPRGSFLGTWFATENTPRSTTTWTMTIQPSANEGVEIEAHDEHSTMCSDAPSSINAASSMTGTGQLRSDTELVIPSPSLTCDDGSQPQGLPGAPLEEQLRNLVFVHDPETDALTDNLGLVWVRVPSDAEATAFLQAFLQARIDGDGAGRFVHGNWEVPLLYATTTGAPYERSEFERVDNPWCCEKQFRVQLFAEGGTTVVEQFLFVDRDETGLLGIQYEGERVGVPGSLPATTENGQALVDRRDFLGGKVTFGLAAPWDYSVAGWDFSPTMTTLVLAHDSGEHVRLVADPRPVETGCKEGPAPADAEELARSIRSDPDLEATAPVAVSVGGIVALRMDVVTATGASVCDYEGLPQVVSETGLDRGSRMRLYLLDLPGGSARILAIAIVAPEARFEQVVEAATPVVDSFEFHAG